MRPPPVSKIVIFFFSLTPLRPLTLPPCILLPLRCSWYRENLFSTLEGLLSCSGVEFQIINESSPLVFSTTRLKYSPRYRKDSMLALRTFPPPFFHELRLTNGWHIGSLPPYLPPPPPWVGFVFLFVWLFFFVFFFFFFFGCVFFFSFFVFF